MGDLEMAERDVRLADAERAVTRMRRLRDASQLRAESSTFSALNIDFGGPLQRQTSAVPGLAAKGSSEFARQLSSSMSLMRKTRVGVGAEKLWGSPLSPGSQPAASREVSKLSLSRQVSELPSRQAGEPATEPTFADARGGLLRFRALVEGGKPDELASLAVGVVWKTPVLDAPSPAPKAALLEGGPSKDVPPTPPGVFVVPKSPAPGASPPRAAEEGSWRAPAESSHSSRRPVRESLGENDDIKRGVQSLLNKVCPENASTIVDRIASINVTTAEQLEIVIEAIFRKALTEPHYCETYADLVFNLNCVFPQFPSRHGGKPMTFKSSVLNVCQNEFEELLTSADEELAHSSEEDADAEELEYNRRKRKDRMRANMKFVGHLFLRQLLSAKVMSSVIMELVLCGENANHVPEDHAIECACELLTSIGYTLEQLPTGFQALELVSGRLLELKVRKMSDGKGVYSKRITFMIQDLLDTRAAGWSMKVFKSSAKTKEEIRLEQERDMLARSRGLDSPGAEHVVAGQRPLYMSPTAAASPPRDALR